MLSLQLGLSFIVASVAVHQVHACQGNGVGCSELYKCCGGLACVKATEIWGFCKNISQIVATTQIATMTTRKDETTRSTSTSRSPTTTQPPAGALITKAQFDKAVTSGEHWYPVPTQDQYLNFVKRAGPSGRITTKRELAMFLANILHESDGLLAKREYGPPPSNWYVYPPMDVPGQEYYGRGYIQLTWSYNYGPASQALYGDNRLLTNADQVASNETVAWDVSFWYWAARVHDQPGISDGKFGVSIKAINGGLECGTNAPNKVGPQHRWKLYKTVYVAFGISGTPDERGCYN